MGTIVTIIQLTIRETQRRRLLWVALLMGIAFLALYGVGFHYIFAELQADIGRGRAAARFLPVIANFLMLTGLYVIHFLVVVVAALLSAGTLSGEIESHTMETLLTKPLRRWQVVLGKWLGYALLIGLYLSLLGGGVILITYWQAGVVAQNIAPGLGLMLLGGLSMLSISLLGGTRLSTLANGAAAFMLYSLAFVGGWVEQIGALLSNDTAVNLGIFSSLLMPADALWKKASLLFQPEGQINLDMTGPFVVVSEPSPLMTWYALGYVLLLLLLALWSFSRRDL